MSQDETTDRNPGITRRRLMGAGAVGAAGIVLPDASQAAVHRTRRGGSHGLARRAADVCVVGAGFAGLTAARDLVRAGHSVIVLEARNRVGGRSFSRPVAGASDVANMGATFVGPGQDRIIALARDFGIGTFETYNRGDNVLYFDGRRATYTGAIPPVDPAALAESAVALAQLDAMAKQVPLEAPWKAPRAAEWDGQTAETWKLANVTSSSARKLIDLAVEAIFSVEPRDVSLLYLLFYIHSGGSLDALINTAGGAQQSRISGGTQSVAIALANHLGRQRVWLSSGVRRIVWRRARAVVETDRVVVSARRVIVALPPTLAGRIEYAPGVPALRDQLTQRVPMGSLIKTYAIYDRPFWRDDGLTGQATSDTGPAQVTFDCSPRSGRPGMLMGFVDGQASRDLTDRPLAERRRLVLESYARYFGERALHPRRYTDLQWDREPHSRGCPVGVLGPGALTGFGRALREPTGPIHWAGTETATRWAGYMDGAVRSGERAAAEVLAELRRRSAGSLTG